MPGGALLTGILLGAVLTLLALLDGSEPTVEPAEPVDIEPLSRLDPEVVRLPVPEDVHTERLLGIYLEQRPFDAERWKASDAEE